MENKTPIGTRKRKRIAFLFLLTIVIPSLLLGLFALRSLENESILFQKTVEEEQAALLQSVTSNLESAIEESEQAFEQFISSKSLRGQRASESQWKKLLRDNPIIKQPFLFRRGVETVFPLARPVFTIFPGSSTALRLKPIGDSLFIQAERSELLEKNLQEAAEKYQLVFKQTRDPGLRPELLLRIARCYKNIPDVQNALSTYLTLATDYPREQTSSGIPYRVAATLEMSDLLHTQGRDSVALENLLLLADELMEPQWSMEKEQLIHFLSEIGNRKSALLKTPPVSVDHARKPLVDLERRANDRLRETQRLVLLAKDVIPFAEQVRGDGGSSKFYRMFRQTSNEAFLITSYRLKNSRESESFVVTGFEIEEEVLRTKILPDLLQPLRLRGDIVCTVRDQQGNLVNGEGAPSIEPSKSSGFSNNVPPWTIHLHMQNRKMLDLLFESRRSVYVWLIVLAAGVLVFGAIMTVRLSAREWELAKQQSDFVSSVSHEFRSPLTAISQVIEMLERGRVLSDERRNRYFGAIKEETHRLIRMVDNILSVARIEVAQKEYEFEFVDPRAVIIDALEHFQNQITRNGIRLDTTLPNSLPSLRADRSSLLEALLNLLDNALKYSTESKRIDLSASANGEELAISIRDYGIGINKKEQDRIFEKFYRTEDVRRARLKGTGLGLALVKEIVQAHKGTISVESELGKGSIFTLKLPIHSDESNTEPS